MSRKKTFYLQLNMASGNACKSNQLGNTSQLQAEYLVEFTFEKAFTLPTFLKELGPLGARRDGLSRLPCGSSPRTQPVARSTSHTAQGYY